jgi:hypothetical protein
MAAVSLDIGMARGEGTRTGSLTEARTLLERAIRDVRTSHIYCTHHCSTYVAGGRPRRLCRRHCPP